MNFVSPKDILLAKAKAVPILSKSGRIPPQNIEMEQAVLGALLLERNSLGRISDQLKPDMFYKEGHRVIYEAIIKLSDAYQPVDLYTIKNALSADGKLEIAGGTFYLTELTSRVASAANIEYHARVIIQKSMLRELIKIGDLIVNQGFDETTDPIALQEEAATLIAMVSEAIDGDASRTVAEAMPDFMRYLRDVAKRREEAGSSITGITTGNLILDYMTGGLQGGELIVVGARPAMGKTHNAIHFMLAAAEAGHKVAFYSYEMTEREVLGRVLANLADINSRKIRRATFDEEEAQRMIQAGASKAARNVVVSDCTNMSISKLCRSIRRKVAVEGVKAVYIDYLGLIQRDEEPSGKRREIASDNKVIGNMAKRLKELAKALNVPIVLYCQLNRDVETRPGKRPTSSDLRDSGEVEQHANMILLLFRPFYYIDSDKAIQKEFKTLLDEELKRLLLIIIAKQREGEVGVVPTFIELSRARIDNITDPGTFARLGGSFLQYLKAEIKSHIGIRQAAPEGMVSMQEATGKDNNSRQFDFPF